MGWMVYLIIVTQRIMPKIWDPYDILGVSRVRLPCHQAKRYRANTYYSPPAKRQSRSSIASSRSSTTPTRRPSTPP